MTVLFWIALALVLAGFRLAFRLFSGAPGDDADRTAGDLSIVIPARNEEQNLPRLLRSISAQAMKVREVLVVDDGSTDRTAELGRALGAEVIPSEPLPEGWRGKTWACFQGAKRSSGAWLLFLDADTWFENGGLPMLLDRAQDSGAFSVCPWHAVQAPYEDLSLFFNLDMVLGTIPNGLFGQALLVDRVSYWRVGGHQTVKGRILENFFLALAFRDAGVPVGSATGRRALSFRMYAGGVQELVRGWIKGFASGAGSTPAGTLGLIVAWKIGLMLVPLGWVVFGATTWFGPLYLLCAAQVAWFGRRIGKFRWWSGLLYPVPLLFFFVVFTVAVFKSGRTVQWKGRAIRAG